MLKVDVIDSEMSPYCSAIRSIFTKAMPSACATHQDKVDSLTEIILGTGQHRYGPIPSPEVLVSIRESLAHAVRNGSPINILIPMGPKKSVLHKGIDIAEFSTMNILAELNTRVSLVHAPGCFFRYRVEDSTGHFLETDVTKEDLISTINTYVNGFNTLRRIMLPYCSGLYLESSNMNQNTFLTRGESLVPYLYRYISDTDAVGIDKYETLLSYKELMSQGWKGCIPLEQRSYYYHLYANRYPGKATSFYQDMLARYFAITLARYQLGGVGNEDWTHPLTLNFMQPVPGSPMGGKRLFYRTLPLNQSKKHVPFWRTKGIVKVSNKITFSLTQDWEDPNLIPCKTSISNGELYVDLDSDYIIQE